MLPDSVWDTLSALLQGSLSAFHLRGKVVRCAFIVYAQFYFRTLSQLEEYPWCLAVGNIVENLHSLSQLPAAPTEPVAGKIWHLLQKGFPVGQLVSALTLLL